MIVEINKYGKNKINIIYFDGITLPDNIKITQV